MRQDRKEQSGLNIGLWLKLIPITGWIYIMIGLFVRFDNILLIAAWWIDVALCVGVHAIQLLVALPIGRKAGVSDKVTIINTMLYGAVWWRPLKNKCYEKS